MTNNSHSADWVIHMHMEDCWPTYDGIKSYIFSMAKWNGDGLVVSVNTRGKILDYTIELAMSVKIIAVIIGNSSKELGWLEQIGVVKHEKIWDHVGILTHDPREEL